MGAAATPFKLNFFDLGAPLAMTTPSIIIVGDVEEITAGLAMDGVGIMSLQTALRARMTDLVGSDDRLGKADEQGDTDNHGDDRSELSHWPWQGDIAKPCRCHRRYREIERVDEA